ncbi:2,3-butanediol dehydrogenase [Alkalihalobacterium alkalinitrilicum]|uniref:2,3-butanediol dehydrogenase n=1 Tax=Alkalihalobacterium alkalinitrilicum TaxID=427920 RepID=UPI0009959FEE|nr:2,3-butanediol dehydrogenase [Alkalihalobacterium alkalinitrilicum]
MKAVKWYGKQDIRIEEIEEPILRPGQVKVKVEWCGICGSDLHAYQHGVGVQENKLHPLTGQKAPLILGHEFSGTIIEVENCNRNVKVGDRVAIEPLLFCRNCRYCHQGKYNLCDSYGFLGLHGNGGFADFVVVSEEMIHKLPDNVSLEEGALIEPTAVVLQAVKESSIKLGDLIAIFGVGPIGLLTVIAAKAAGASTIIAIDISEERLELAKGMGADFVINASEENVVKTILSTYGRVDVVYEASGVQESFFNAITVLKKGGEMMVVSLSAEPIQVNMLQFLTKEINLKGSLAYRHIFPHVIALISSGQLDVKKIITKKIPIEAIVEDGFNQLLSDKSQAKILVKMN